MYITKREERNLDKIMDSYDFISSFYDEAVINETYEKMNGNVAVYAGGANIVTANGVVKSEYGFGWINSRISVPVIFFAHYFNAIVMETEVSYSITRGDISILGKVGEKRVFVNGTEYTLGIEAYKVDSLIYVSGADIADNLGLNYEIDRKLFVVGTSNTVKEFGRRAGLGVNEKGEIVSYLAYHDETNPEKFAEEDCTAAKMNWVRSLVGDVTTNDVQDNDIKNKIDAINQIAKASWDKLIKDMYSKEIFNDIISTDSKHITAAYSHVYNMACGFACYGGELYQNETLLKDIIYALDWLEKNRYNSNIYNVNDIALWHVTGFNNWWDWAIGTPQKLIPILMMIENRLRDTEIKRYLEFFDEHVPVPRMTGANFTDLAHEVTGSALLQNNSALVLKVQTMITKTFLYVDDNKRFAESLLGEDRQAYTPIKGAGFFTDGSYILHTLHPQNATYGALQFGILVDFLCLFANTRFEMKIPFVDHVFSMYKESFDSVIYDGKIFRWTLGRSQGKNTYNYFEIHADAFKVAPALNDEHEKAIYHIIKGIGLEYQHAFISALPLDCIRRYKEILSADSISGEVVEVKNKVFYNTDKVVHKTCKWAASVSMSSSRIFTYESINKANMDGWYLSDGRTEYYLKGSNVNASKHEYESLNKYRMPGTTVDTQERLKVSIHQGNEYLSSKDFVGGVSLGDYGIAAMELESYHNDTDYGVDGGGYGGLAPAHKCNLTAKKAYFMLEQELICLGTDINASNDAEVLTVVDNLMSRNIGLTVDNVENTLDSDFVIADGNKIDIFEEEYVLDNVFWLNYADICGYIFPKINTRNFGKLKTHKTRGRDSWFELWFSHGVNPTNGSYAYILLPGQTAEETLEYANKTKVSILANNSSVQAVTDASKGITGIVFWAAGRFGNITVSEPCIVMCRECENDVEFAISDPTQKLKNIAVTLHGGCKDYDADECISVKLHDSYVVLECDMNDSVGRSMKVFLSK